MTTGKIDHVRDILVIGGGFVGRSIALGLAEAHVPVRLLTRRAPAQVPAGLRTTIGDATDADLLGAALLGATDVVFCAGSALPAEAELDPSTARRQDLAPLLTVVEALRSRSPARLLYLSSGGTIYGEPDVLPVPESHPLRPRSVYGILKVEAEACVMGLREERGGATALRCSNVYGPAQLPWRSQGVIATLIAAASSGREVPLYGDGQAVRDHLWVDDVGAVVQQLIGRTDLPPAVNVGSGVGTTLDELVDRVAEVVGTDIRVRYERARPTDLHSVLLDISMLRSLTDFEPTPLTRGLQRILALENPPNTVP